MPDATEPFSSYRGGAKARIVRTVGTSGIGRGPLTALVDTQTAPRHADAHRRARPDTDRDARAFRRDPLAYTASKLGTIQIVGALAAGRPDLVPIASTPVSSPPPI